MTRCGIGALLLVACVLLVLGGCPAIFDPDEAAVVRLRASCPSRTDQEIQTLITSGKADRDAGHTASEVLHALAAACPATECVVCGTAVIDYVYGL